MMKKLFLMPLLALFAFASCSDDNKEPYFHVQTTTLYFDSRNPEPKTVTVIAENITKWEIERIYDINESIDNPEWCKAVINKDNSITVTVASNESETEYREAEVLIVYYWNKGGASTEVSIKVNQSTYLYTQEELADMANKIFSDVEASISYSVGNNSSVYSKEVNKFRIINGLFQYDGGTYESYGYGTLINDPFELEVTLRKTYHENFYPYNKSEYITIKGDDGKDLKIDGTVYLSDYVYQSTGTPANFKAGSFSLRISGGKDMSLYHYIY